MTPIEKLKGISTSEATALSRLGIKTIDGLWFKIGENFEEIAHQVKTKGKISPVRLIDLLTAQALWEIEGREKPWYRRAAPGMVLAGFLAFCIGSVLIMTRTPSLITPLGGLCVILLVITVLALRALGAFDKLPMPLGWLGLPEGVPASLHDLPNPTDRKLKTPDLVLVPLAPSEGYFASIKELEGLELTLAKPVKSRQPIRFSDVKRSQLIAKNDIAAGHIIGPDDVENTPELTTYDPQAALKPKDVQGGMALVKIRKGEVVLLDKISRTSGAKQVVISNQDLLPFRLIKQDQIKLREGTVAPGVFTQTQEVIDLWYPSRLIPKETVLERTQLLPVIEDFEAVLANRQLLSLRIAKGAYSAAATPGKRVSLIFSPHKDSTRSPVPVKLDDVLILDVKPEADGAAAFVFAADVGLDTLDKLAFVLGRSAVFVIQPANPG